MISYDLETCLLKKGKKRKDVLILSIGAVDVINPSRTFHCFVNPLSSTKKAFMNDLENYGVRIKPTNTVINNIRWRSDKAKTPEKALIEFQMFIQQTPLIYKEPIIVAHNGRSFDHKIICGTFDRANMAIPDMRFLDSLHDITRKCFKKQKCHKLGILHNVLCKDSVLSPQWHHALDDAQALTEIITATAVEEMARKPREAWYYAGKNKEFVKQIKKEHNIPINTDMKLTDTLIKAWPFIITKNAKHSKSLKKFALYFTLDVVWKTLLR